MFCLVNHETELRLKMIWQESHAFYAIFVNFNHFIEYLLYISHIGDRVLYTWDIFYQ